MKWAGGKRQLLPEISKHIPKFSTYFEPFIGGGAVLFSLQPKKVVINDFNEELINVYLKVKDNPDELISLLQIHKNNNSSDYYYQIRALDRDKVAYSQLTDVERAARILYLNKTCFNGLFRVNNAGEFNSPYGKYSNPNIVNDITIRAVSNYFNMNDVRILSGDYSDAVMDAKKGDFVYFDPPYDPISNSASFTGYTQGGFDKREQIRLKEVCDELNSRKVRFLLSNSDTEFINDLYQDYTITKVSASRAINSVAEKRGDVQEVLIQNF